MEKVRFALNADSGWPPVSSEAVWCEREGENYKLVNSPFFIPDLAYGDIISALPDSVNGHIFEYEIVEKSGHSVVWMMNNVGLDTSDFTALILELGCKIEGLDNFDLYSIDLPVHIDIDAFDGVISTFESMGLNFAYPTWRHGD